MSQKAIDAVFSGLFHLTDIRVILRRTAPLHQLNDAEQESARKSIEAIRKQLAVLEEDLL
ncbi:MAG: hypothetical protein LBU24_06380 [Methanocalculaceae archaeon]|jgi:hypothetical protein|nr:hypothetical protein [Methanocalculaceae archaeon]